MFNYYVIEIQTNATGAPGNIVTGYADKLTAEDAFHSLITYINDSKVLVHTAMFIDKYGNHVEPPKSYTHPVPLPTEETTSEQ